VVEVAEIIMPLLPLRVVLAVAVHLLAQEHQEHHHKD